MNYHPYMPILCLAHKAYVKHFKHMFLFSIPFTNTKKANVFTSICKFFLHGRHKGIVCFSEMTMRYYEIADCSYCETRNWSAIEINCLPAQNKKKLSSNCNVSLGSVLQLKWVHFRSSLGSTMIQIIELIKSKNSSEFPKSHPMNFEQFRIRRGQMGLVGL